LSNTRHGCSPNEVGSLDDDGSVRGSGTMKPSRADYQLQDYFLRRSIELLERAKHENDPAIRDALEDRILKMWGATTWLTITSLNEQEKKLFSFSDDRQLTPCPNRLEPEMIAFTTEQRGWTREKTEREYERFADYHIAKGSKYVDWSAAWRTWVNNGIRMASEREHQKRNDREGPPW
jgi:hypothetical protein